MVLRQLLNYNDSSLGLTIKKSALINMNRILILLLIGITLQSCNNSTKKRRG